MTEENVDLHLMFQNYIVGLEKNVALCCISLGPIHNCTIAASLASHGVICLALEWEMRILRRTSCLYLILPEFKRAI